MTETWLAGWRPYLLLGALCLCLYLPGIARIPVLDRDEARFAQATRQMLETGDLLDIRFRDEARNNKPAGIYWLQAASVAALSTPQSTAIWPYRLPSLLGAVLAVVLTFGLGRALTGDARRAMIGAMLLAAALGIVAEAHIAKTDAALLAATVGGQGMLGLAYIRFRAGERVALGTAAGFWFAEIVAIYLKGPIGPGLAVVTAATLAIADRDARWVRGLRPVVGLIVTALAVVPWLCAIEHATQGQFLQQSVGHDFWAKVMGGQDAHGAWPLFYLGLAFLTFWPGSLYLVPAVIAGWRRRADPAARFLLAWLIPAWIVLELVPTKLPHYTLPLYPALALLAADALSGSDSPRWCRAISTALWLLATVFVAVALADAPFHLGNGLSPAAVAGALAVIVLAGLVLLQRPGPGATAALLAAMSLAFIVPAGGFVIPGLDRLWLSRSAAAMVARDPPSSGTLLTVIGYNEPSLVFLLGGRLKSGMPDAPVASGDEALVGDRQAPAFAANLAARGLAAQPIHSAGGIDYSNGQRMTLTLFRIVPR